MTNFTRAWGTSYEALPPDSGENASLGASRIRNFKADIRERMVIDHLWNDNLSSGSTDGYHTKVTLPQRADPSSLADAIILYGKDYNNGTNTRTELFWIDEQGNVVRLTERGALALLKTANQWSKSQVTPEVTLTDAATVTVDASLGNAFKLTLAGNRVLAEPTDGVAGQTISIRVIQDATGNRTLDVVTNYRGSQGDDFVFSTGANDEDLLVLYCAAPTDWRVVNLKKDFDTNI